MPPPLKRASGSLPEIIIVFELREVDSDCDW